MDLIIEWAGSGIHHLATTVRAGNGLMIQRIASSIDGPRSLVVPYRETDGRVIWPASSAMPRWRIWPTVADYLGLDDAALGAWTNVPKHQGAKRIMETVFGAHIETVVISGVEHRYTHFPRNADSDAAMSVMLDLEGTRMERADKRLLNQALDAIADCEPFDQNLYTLIKAFRKHPDERGRKAIRVYLRDRTAGNFLLARLSIGID